jgi:hypothetical protein
MSFQGAFTRRVTRGGFSLLLLGLACITAADTLYLQGGDRVEGTLVGVSGRTIEFEENDRGRTRLRRYDRTDVRRIEIDDRGSSSGSSYDDRGSSGGSAGVGAGSNTSGLRERTVTVSSTSPWTDTGVELRRGQEIQVRATGKVKWGPGRNDGPNGEGGNHYNAARPLPDRPAASLIGRTGDRDDVFFIGGESGAIRIRDGGRLYLGINDDFLQDNSGFFKVTVYY